MMNLMKMFITTLKVCLQVFLYKKLLQRIYTLKKLNLFVKKTIFKKLLLNLTRECVFSVNNRLINQIDGCPMGGSISVVFSDIYVSKMDEDIVAPTKPKFYERYVDDTYIR